MGMLAAQYESLKAYSTAHLSPAPALSSCVPCKMEAQVEVHDAYPNSSLNIPVLFPNQFGEGGSAPASGDADGDALVSEASSSQQHIRIGCPQRGLVSAGASELQQHIDSEHSASGPHPCSEDSSSSGSGLQQNIDLEHPVSGPHPCCEDSSSSGSGLQHHNNALHSIETSYRFPDCKQSCTTNDSMKKHIRSKPLSKSKHQNRSCLNLCANKVNPQQNIFLKHSPRNAQKHSRSKPADECNGIMQKRVS
ncbi:uncharacterized protein LOC108672961 [Hyalella azteca]|uniref:Uncharacterized protein LOC108672961 n=1 Tax=Hyalella azteca TaxID=294128 RepID=A0A8B7NR93_HYAAZ|nr:uncharacterized protein LOC108672961 [Hyalella azteca]